MNGEEHLTELNEEIDLISRRVQAKDWKDYTPKTFHLNLTRALEEFEKLHKILEKFNSWMKAKGYSDSIELQKQINSIETLEKFLEKNIELEEKKSVKLNESELAKQVLDENLKELYSSIENKVLNELLKLRYFSERASLHLKRRETPLKFESSGKKILLLLEQKEKELQELQEKYSQLRLEKRSFMTQEKNSAELEKDLNELTIKAEKETALLKEKINENRKKIEEINSEMHFIEKKISYMDELNASIHLKSMELTGELKKERDYSRKTSIETEHETMKLRSAYSKQLLELEKEKFSAKKEAEKDFEKEITELHKELKEKNDLIKRLEKIID
ncbi:MAG: hypothetical protein JW703_02805, partial [Candidatus Diapherotrites archaeon]|nr:hypothetical protein [Candidatus Diapherotrites archaeon]